MSKCFSIYEYNTAVGETVPNAHCTRREVRSTKCAAATYLLTLTKSQIKTGPLEFSICR